MVNKLTQTNVEELIRQYQLIGNIFKDTGNSTLKSLAATWDITLIQIKGRLASSQKKTEEQAAIRGLNQGLMDLPKVIKSADKDNYIDILTRIEKEVGIQLTQSKGPAK